MNETSTTPAAAEVSAATADQAATGHGRTPDNTPIPGGGRWAWDDAEGAWISRDPKPEPKPEADPQTPAAGANQE